MRYRVLRAPAAREYGPEFDVSKFQPGKNINLDESAAQRWVRRGVLALYADAKARVGEGADDADGDAPEE